MNEKGWGGLVVPGAPRVISILALGAVLGAASSNGDPKGSSTVLGVVMGVVVVEWLSSDGVDIMGVVNVGVLAAGVLTGVAT